MKQTIQIALIIALIIFVIMYATRFNQSGTGYQQVERKTTTKYKREAPTGIPASEMVHTTTKEKQTRDGSEITVKEHVKTSSQ